jgi:hypothetical protein
LRGVAPMNDQIAMRLTGRAQEYRLAYIGSFKGVYLSPPFPTLEVLFSKRAAIQRARKRRGLPEYTHIASFVPMR